MKSTISIAEFKKLAKLPKGGKREHKESNLQKACVAWFRMAYPKYRLLLFAIPNGGTRSKIEAANLKAEGVVPGVADMFLAVYVDHENVGHKYQGIHGLFIEFKFGKNKQTGMQKKFESEVKNQWYWYSLIYDFDSFQKLIQEYLA